MSFELPKVLVVVQNVRIQRVVVVVQVVVMQRVVHRVRGHSAWTEIHQGMVVVVQMRVVQVVGPWTDSASSATADHLTHTTDRWGGQLLYRGHRIVVTATIGVARIGTTAAPLLLLLLLGVGVLLASPGLPAGHAVHEAHLEDLAGFEGSSRQQHHGTGHVSCLHADHVGVLVVSEVTHLPRLVQPRIPDDRVREVILLQAHLPAGHYVGHNVLRRCVLVDPIGPLVDRHHVSALLVDRALPRLVDERAAVEARDLAAPYVGHLQVRVQEEVERERDVLAGVVDANVEVQLLLAQDQAVRYPEARRLVTGGR